MIDLVRRRSLEVLVDNQHASGAFPAALGYHAYNYCWFRDGAFVANALSAAGQTDSGTRFHKWCQRILDDRRDRITALVDRANAGDIVPASAMLPTRFTLDGRDGSEDWWDYQLDGYGTWLSTLLEHSRRHQIDLEPFVPVVESIVGYLCTFGDKPCYDWWEEHDEHRHVSTIAAVAAGLEAAAAMVTPPVARAALEGAARLRDLIVTAANPVGHLTKWLGSRAVDGSLLSVTVPFGVIAAGSELAEETYKAILADLLEDGVYRYRGDTFYGGGEWIILTAWLGMYEVETGRIEQAAIRRDWIINQACPNGDLPEQVPTNAQYPSRIEEWQQRWGPVATPLLWSHAMFLTLDIAIEGHELRP